MSIPRHGASDKESIKRRQVIRYGTYDIVFTKSRLARESDIESTMMIRIIRHRTSDKVSTKSWQGLVIRHGTSNKESSKRRRVLRHGTSDIESPKRRQVLRNGTFIMSPPRGYKYLEMAHSKSSTPRRAKNILLKIGKSDRKTNKNQTRTTKIKFGQWNYGKVKCYCFTVFQSHLNNCIILRVNYNCSICYFSFEVFLIHLLSAVCLSLYRMIYQFRFDRLYL